MNQRSRGTADEDVLNLAYRELDAYRVDRGRPVDQCTSRRLAALRDCSTGPR